MNQENTNQEKPKDKFCKKCDLKKPLSEFYDAIGNKDGKTNKCKLCYNDRLIYRKEFNPIVDDLSKSNFNLV